MTDREGESRRRLDLLHGAASVAEAFHEAYHRRAPEFGWEPQTSPEWRRIPAANRRLMVAVASELLERGIIAYTAEEPEE